MPGEMRVRTQNDLTQVALARFAVRMWILSLASLTAWLLATFGCGILSLLCPLASATAARPYSSLRGMTNLADVPCGSASTPRRFLHRRIMGGSEIDITNFPHAVSIKKKGLMWCGGSLVSQSPWSEHNVLLTKLDTKGHRTLSSRFNPYLYMHAGL